MRKEFPGLLLTLLLLFVSKVQDGCANEPDSAYLFAYATDKNYNHNGLHFAWSHNRVDWYPIGPEHSFLKNDYGRWGSEKRMLTPFLFRSPEGLWHCIWSLNERDGAFGHSSSPDLIRWGRQSYTPVMDNGQCHSPAITHHPSSGHYTITWLSDMDGVKTTFSVSTRDFKAYGPTTASAALPGMRESVVIAGKRETGTLHRIKWQSVKELMTTQQLASYKAGLYGETTLSDPDRFASLHSVDALIRADGTRKKEISDLLLGIFYEDINYAADGGLYAELVQNRGFEYSLSDKLGSDDSWHSGKAWRVINTDTFRIDTVAPIHPNNRHYAALQVDKKGVSLINEGFNGIPVTAGEKYNFSLFARAPESGKGSLLIRLIDSEGYIIGEAQTKKAGNNWKKLEVVLVANKTATDARLLIEPQMLGRVDLDMISLFPQKTFNGRRNGLRADLAQTLADMKPRFMRFPGGCVAHGDGLENIYHWKNTIGPLEARRPQRNIWGYHQSFGLGYFEYFQFCEDIGAEPIPVIAAGVPCQNSGHHGCALGGQQGGIPMSEMDHYVQDVLDLIEYANGDAKTEWGRKRAEAGHPEPFNLKYIGVGNEDLITDIFEERFTMIYNAVRERYPEITVIGTVGPFFEGTDYVEGWKLADKLAIPIVDEHYYNPPGWYLHNQDFYDRYDRTKSKVYLGEFAAHLPDRASNMETALAEALHLCNVERNGDIVVMTSYAPLLAKEGYTQWNPDLIYFNHHEVKPTVGYYIQQLFGQHSGDEYIYSEMALNSGRDDVAKRIGKSIVRDSSSGDIIVKLVNLLPVVVNTTIDLSGIGITESKVTKTVLTGSPDERSAKPVTEEVVTGEACGLPPYSFTVLRIKQSR